MREPVVRLVSWVRGSDQDVREGLLGFVSVQLGRVILDGLTLRKTSGGRLALSYPSRTDRVGRRHPYVRPRDDAARIEIEREIIGLLANRLGDAS